MNTTELVIIYTASILFTAVAVIWMYAKLVRLESDYDRLFEELNDHWTQIEQLQAQLDKIKNLLQSFLNKTGSVYLDDEMEAYLAARREHHLEKIKQSLEKEHEFMAEF